MKNSNWAKTEQFKKRNKKYSQWNRVVFVNSSSTKKTLKHRNIQIPKTHEKMLLNLTYSKGLLFTPDDVITNLSSYKNSHGETIMPKHVLGNSILPEILSCTEVFVNFVSSNKISHGEAIILKHVLGNSIPPEIPSCTEVFVNFLS